MRYLGILLAAGTALAALGHPAQAALISSLIPNGTITDEDKLFSGFSCLTTGNQQNACSVLAVSPLSGATGLTFNGGLGASGAAGNQDTIIGYHVEVTDPTQAISQLSLAFNGSILGATSLDDASVSVTETVRSLGVIVGQIVVSAPLDLQDPPFEFLFDIPLTGTFTSLDVTKDIEILTNKAGVSATISFVDQDFEQTGTQVAEPAVLAMMGSGLVTMGLFIRRRR